MNTHRNDEIKDCLAELATILKSYNPKREYFIALVLFSLQAICVIVIITAGWLLGLLLLSVGLLPIIIFAGNGNFAKYTSPTPKELAERACILMSSCVARYNDPDADTYFLDYNCFGDNMRLYNEFVSIFPQMASTKLKKLASIKLWR